MKKLYCVYKHLFPDGKIYIGKTGQRPLTRWYSYEGQYLMENAIKAIGNKWLDIVEHYYLNKDNQWVLWNRNTSIKETNIFDEETAGRLEEREILNHKSNDINLGYNCTSGNDKGFIRTEDNIQRQKEAQPIYYGEENGFYGHTHSLETKQILSQKSRAYAQKMGLINDLSGKRFGKLLVICRAEDYISPKGAKRRKYHCKCDCGNEIDSFYCSLISGKAKSCGHCIDYENSLEYKYPNIVKEWDYDKNSPLTPDKIASCSGKKVWWLCPKGHSYLMAIGNKTSQHQNCPICANKQILKGFNDLESQYPDLVKEWDYNKNSIKPNEITPHSGKKIWWICPKGHSYQKTVSNRTYGQTCPICKKEE